jgi:hypothetical protein
LSTSGSKWWERKSKTKSRGERREEGVGSEDGRKDGEFKVQSAECKMAESREAISVAGV